MPQSSNEESAGVKNGGANVAPPSKRRSRWRFVWWGLAILIIALIPVRLAMPWAVRNYVNRTLDKSQIYQGKIGDVDIHLWRGGYSIRDIRLVKMTGNVPVPLFSAPRVDLSIQWGALLRHGKIVGRFLVEKPEVNFVDAPSEGQSQTGAGGPWLGIIRGLFPFDIDSAIVTDGSVHFRTYQTPTPVDVYLGHVEMTVDDLTNVRNDITPLLTSVDIRALAMDQAKFELKMKLDPFSYRPTLHMGLRLIGLDVTKINGLALAYGKFDFKRGFFDLVIEVDAREGLLSGYVKPLFRDMKVFSLVPDIKEDNVLQFFWQAIVGGVTRALSNQPRDQFGTLIPFQGDVTNARPNILATIGNVLRNAFIRAYLPMLQDQSQSIDGLDFDPPSLTDPTSIGDIP
ncbi:MAG TPA: DUF748 domain-containing protein [Humisphaera sp.]|nr:DUF748 domain-containing protein [Humisphaera sp.]